MKPNPFVFAANKDLEENTLFLTPEFSSSRPHQSRLVRLKPSEVIVESIHERFIKNIYSTIETHIADTGFCVAKLADENSISTRI